LASLPLTVRFLGARKQEPQLLRRGLVFLAPFDEPGLATAMRHFQAGEMEAAGRVLGSILADRPDDGRARLLLGLVRADQSDFAAAEAAFLRAVADRTEPDFALHMLGELRKRQQDDAGAVAYFERAALLRPDFAPNLNALGAALQRLGRHAEALAVLDRAVGIDPLYGTALCNRGLLLEVMQQADAAAASFRGVLALTPVTSADWHTRGLACLHLNEFGDAEVAARAALRSDPGHLAAYLLLAEVLERMHRLGEASAVRAELGRRQRIVRQPCFSPAPITRVLLIAGSALCNIPTQYVMDRSRFDVTLMHLAPNAGTEDVAALLAALPDFDVAFNVIGDADTGARFLDAAEAFCADLPCPVLNPPAKISPTRRDRLPSLLDGIPGLVVPGIRRLRHAQVAALARDAGCAPWPMPWLIRPIGSHGGVDLERIDRAGDLDAYLDRVPVEEYYLSGFHDYRGADGMYRKARFLFVGRAVLPYHLATCRDWLAHYWRAEMADDRRTEEAAFLADPTTLFSEPALRTIQHVATRLDLDFAGIDCAAMPDGRVLIFEANATMLVHVTGSADAFAYQHAHIPRIRDALSTLMMKRIDSRATSAGSRSEAYA
jgi:tetratricopeptide (TPR) repeat protein